MLHPLNDTTFLVFVLTQRVYSIVEQAVVRQSCNVQQCVCVGVRGKVCDNPL